MIRNCMSSLPQSSGKEEKTEEMDIAVNVDYEDEKCAERWKFRVSDENNGDIYYVFISDPGISTGNRKLLLRDAGGKDQIIMLYQHGSGMVRLFEPKGQFIGECNSVVGFRCLSIKVKYLFLDNVGERIFKIGTEMHPYSNESSFKLSIKDSNNEEIGCIKMGRLKNCCHVKLNIENFTNDEKMWIIALWTSFNEWPITVHFDVAYSVINLQMDYELLENDVNNDEFNPESL